MNVMNMMRRKEKSKSVRKAGCRKMNADEGGVIVGAVENAEGVGGVGG